MGVVGLEFAASRQDAGLLPDVGLTAAQYDIFLDLNSDALTYVYIDAILADSAADFPASCSATEQAGNPVPSRQAVLGASAIKPTVKILSPQAEQQLETFYAANYYPLVGLAFRIVRSIHVAEELVQDLFADFSSGKIKLRDEDKMPAYCRQAVVNNGRSVLRHLTVVDKHNSQYHPPDMESAESGAMAILERSAVAAALRSLPGRQREAIMLRYYGDMGEPEIAAAMGISRGAVKSHTARGMAALRDAMAE